MSRADDVINVAGHRISTSGIEEVIATHESIAECAVIAANDKLKGHVPVGFIVLKSGLETTNTETVEKEIIQT
eukprot:UN01558